MLGETLVAAEEARLAGDAGSADVVAPDSQSVCMVAAASGASPKGRRSQVRHQFSSATPGPLSDRDIRSAFRTYLTAQASPASNLVVIEELGLCRGASRLDLASVDEAFHGYEIKSERDSLRRLPQQARVYSDVLDHVTAVITRRHLERVLSETPAWWAVVVAESDMQGGIAFTSVRVGSANRDVNKRALAELIWYDDAIRILEERGLARGYRGRPKWRLLDRICEVMETDELRAAVRALLRARAMQQFAPPQA